MFADDFVFVPTGVIGGEAAEIEGEEAAKEVLLMIFLTGRIAGEAPALSAGDFEGMLFGAASFLMVADDILFVLLDSPVDDTDLILPARLDDGFACVAEIAFILFFGTKRGLFASVLTDLEDATLGVNLGVEDAFVTLSSGDDLASFSVGVSFFFFTIFLVEPPP